MALRNLSTEVVFGITLVVVAIVLFGTLFYTSGPSPAERAAEEFRIVLGTAGYGPPRTAWMRLHEDTRRQFSLDSFESLVKTHPVFGPFESFKVDSGDGSKISGELRVTGDAFRIVATFENQGEDPKLTDVQVDNRSLFGLSVPSSDAVQN